MALTSGIPNAVDVAATEIEAVLAKHSTEQRDALLAAAAECEQAFGRLASAIRGEAAARLRLGAPPSLRRLVGISNLEVPMNRVLGWTLDPESRGLTARPALLALSKLLDFSTLSADIEHGPLPEVLVETSPDGEITTRQPDLMIRSERAAVLIENKVASPESGPSQYADYLAILRAWAGSREYRAYLLSPTERTVPEGWNGSLSHRQLADALQPLAHDQGVSLWDRIVYALLASDLDPDTNPDRMREVARLVEGEHSLSEVAVATKLAQLLRHPAIDPRDGGS